MGNRTPKHVDASGGCRAHRSLTEPTFPRSCLRRYGRYGNAKLHKAIHQFNRRPAPRRRKLSGLPCASARLQITMRLDAGVRRSRRSTGGPHSSLKQRFNVAVPRQRCARRHADVVLTYPRVTAPVSERRKPWTCIAEAELVESVVLSRSAPAEQDIGV